MFDKTKAEMIRPWFRQAAVPWKTTATQTRASGENRVSTKPGVLHPGFHDGVAVGVDAGAGGDVERLGRMGAFDDPVVSGRAGGVPGLCVRYRVWLAGGVRAARGCPAGAGLP